MIQNPNPAALLLYTPEGHQHLVVHPSLSDRIGPAHPLDPDLHPSQPVRC
jgi:hypothetical protein